MEALRTQLDVLRWEVNRLEAENQKLRDANESASRCVDLERELLEVRKESARRISAADEKIASLECAASENRSDAGGTQPESSKGVRKDTRSRAQTQA